MQQKTAVLVFRKSSAARLAMARPQPPTRRRQEASKKTEGRVSGLEQKAGHPRAVTATVGATAAAPPLFSFNLLSSRDF